MAKRPARKRASAPEDRDSVVVYVHGGGEPRAADDLKLEWDLALFGRDRSSATRMAYWSDIAPARNPTRKGADSPPEDLSAEGILAQAGIDGRNERARAFVDALKRVFGIEDDTRSVAPASEMRSASRFMKDPASGAFAKHFIVNMAAYFFDAKRRLAIRERVTGVLPGSGVPVTVVAHREGSVIALEVLARCSKLTVAKLVTIGSPLGLQPVQGLLDVHPHRKPFEMPRCVERWDNFVDPADSVAPDGRLSGDFVLSPEVGAGERLQTLVADQIVANAAAAGPRGYNPSSAVRYLSHPKVRRSVYETSRFDAMARFVIARDVAEALGRDDRHPVLIEVLEPGYAAVDESPEDQKKREEKAGPSLQDRITRAASDLGALVKKTAIDAGASDGDAERRVGEARIDPLRRFVAAHLNPDELKRVAQEHRKFNVYAVWRSTAKRKLLHRSRSVLQADAALESYGAAGARIRWAVLDTGVRSDHPHFFDRKTRSSRIVALWDCTQPGPPRKLKKDDDADGHGSHVAGIIAGASADGPRTYCGVAPRAELVVYKVLSDRGEGEDAWIIKALDHIAAENESSATLAIHGLNLSLGGPYDSTVYGCGFTPICQELRRLWRSGVLVVVACGNEGQLQVQTRDGDVDINAPMSIGDPANLEDCIAVGSVNADRPHLYGISSFSSRGPTSDGRCKPDVVAPGERITSVNARFQGKRRLYRVESGTSMAAPHVSGLLAAFLSVRREFIGRPDEVKKILLDTCTDIGRDRHHQGHGIPNLMKMLLSV